MRISDWSSDVFSSYLWERLRDDFAAIRLSGGSNHLPLLWRFFASHRAALMRLARTLDFVSATQNQSLMDALAVVLANEGRKAEWVSNSVDLRFCSERWRKLIVRPEDDGPPVRSEEHTSELQSLKRKSYAVI